jgi:hypothetical protein
MGQSQTDPVTVDFVLSPVASRTDQRQGGILGQSLAGEVRAIAMFIRDAFERKELVVGLVAPGLLGKLVKFRVLGWWCARDAESFTRNGVGEIVPR